MTASISAINKQIANLQAKAATAVANQNSVDIIFPDVTFTSTGKEVIMDTSANADVLFDAYKATVAFNEMSKNIEMEIPGTKFVEDTKDNVQLHWLRERARKHSMSDKNIVEYVDMFASRNSYHPVRDWISSEKWDGVDRLEAWFATITTTHPMKHLLMKKWALSAVAAVFEHTFKGEGVLILIGPQGLGKTTWGTSLVYDLDWVGVGKDLNPGNKDEVLAATKYWITELGELNKLFRKAEIEDLKNFITRDVDELRPAYARKDNKYKRRTVFFGTANERTILVDDENRRYWTMDVTAVNFKHGINMQQFWAQIKEQFYDTGEQWWLTEDERRQLSSLQAEHKAPNATEELLSTCVSHPQAPGGKYAGIVAEAIKRKVEAIDNTAERLNATAILIRCGVNDPKPIQIKHAVNWLYNNGFEIQNKAKKDYLVVINPLVRNSGFKKDKE